MLRLVVLIGDRKSRDKEYAIEAISLVGGYAFITCYNLHKLYIGIIQGNEASKRAFEKVGFKVEDILEEHFYLNDKYLACYRMGLLKNEHKET